MKINLIYSYKYQKKKKNNLRGLNWNQFCQFKKASIHYEKLISYSQNIKNTISAVLREYFSLDEKYVIMEYPLLLKPIS